MNECCNAIKKTIDGVCVICVHNRVCGIRDKFKSFSNYVDNIDCDHDLFSIVPKCNHFMSANNKAVVLN